MRKLPYVVADDMRHNPDRPRPIQINPVIGCPILFLGVLFAFPYAIGVMIYQKVREHRLFHRLNLMQRTLPWSQVEQYLRDGSGTLIIEQAQKQVIRLWWTHDDVTAKTPYPPPPFDELNLIFADPKQPFVGWCFEQYLSPSTGTAALTHPKKLSFPPGFVTPSFFIAQFPLARVIATTLKA